MVRDQSGASVAVAPKADIGISGASLLLANPRIESFRLVDANMTIRIDTNGQVNVIIGGEKPFSVIPPAPAPQAWCATPAAIAAGRAGCAGPRLPRLRRRAPAQVQARPHAPNPGILVSVGRPARRLPRTSPRSSNGSTSSAGSDAKAPVALTVNR